MFYKKTKSTTVIQFMLAIYFQETAPSRSFVKKDIALKMLHARVKNPVTKLSQLAAYSMYQSQFEWWHDKCKRYIKLFNSEDVFNHHMKHFDFSFLPCKMHYKLPIPASQKRYRRSYETFILQVVLVSQLVEVTLSQAHFFALTAR